MSWLEYNELPSGFDFLRDAAGQRVARDPLRNEWILSGDGQAYRVSFRWARPDPAYILVRLGNDLSHEELP